MAGRNRRFNFPRPVLSGQIVPVSIVRIAPLLEKQQERTHRRGMADIERTVAVSDAEHSSLGLPSGFITSLPATYISWLQATAE